MNGKITIKETLDSMKDMVTNYDSKVFYVGSRWRNSQGCECEVIGKLPTDYSVGRRSMRYFIRFLDGYGAILSVDKSGVRPGLYKNPYFPNVYGKGYLGYGDRNSKTDYKGYQVWVSMLRRCYGPREKGYDMSYYDVDVCEEWRDFQKFVKWFNENYIYGYVLDKDLLNVGKSKLYSPYNCIFIPLKVNSFLTNDKSNNTSGCTGVSKSINMDKWRVRIQDFTTGKSKSLGYYESLEEADAVYKIARREETEKMLNYIGELGYDKKVLDIIRRRV